MIICLQAAKPLNSDFANNMATFNEVFTLIFLYMLLCFTDWVTDPELSH